MLKGLLNVFSDVKRDQIACSLHDLWQVTVKWKQWHQSAKVDCTKFDSCFKKRRFVGRIKGSCKRSALCSVNRSPVRFALISWATVFCPGSKKLNGLSSRHGQRTSRIIQLLLACYVREPLLLNRLATRLFGHRLGAFCIAVWSVKCRWVTAPSLANLLSAYKIVVPFVSAVLAHRQSFDQSMILRRLLCIILYCRSKHIN